MIELSKIKSPADIRGLSLAECEELADSIREKIIHTVSHTGGHLSSNLGVVEITLALHRVFDTPVDKLIFDVGHQTYTHKLITGRYQQFDTLRTYGGISGFPMRNESEYDCFEGGHASTALSAALGYARARDALKQDYQVVAVVGDGALTGGMCYEALNDCGHSGTHMVVLLNDNEMSIARNVGALSNHLSMLRASRQWNNTKTAVKSRLSKIPLVGEPMYHAVHNVKCILKSVFVNEGFFTSLGFKYLGPIDGNDQEALENLLEKAKLLDGPVVVHCITKKGRGYSIAEDSPEAYHGTPPFLVENGETSTAGIRTYGEIAAEKLVQLRAKHPEICAVTAAMPMGTGASVFAKHWPESFYDVGIAEEHAVTLCAGMASGGLRPFFFIYSTFLQRAYDQIIHDVCMQHQPVVFLIDRAGLNGEDGQSHQGIFDIAFLRTIPGMKIFAPADAKELEEMIEAAYQIKSPCAIRYPKSEVRLPDALQCRPFVSGRWDILREGKDGIVLSVGTMTANALKAAEMLSSRGISICVVNASSVVPLDSALLKELLSENRPVFCAEEAISNGGFGSSVLEMKAGMNSQTPVHILGTPDAFIQHGNRKLQLRDAKLDAEGIAETIYQKLSM